MASPKQQKNTFDTFIDTKYVSINRKTKIISIIIALAIPLALFYFLMFKSNQEKISKLENNIETTSLELKRAKKAAQNLPLHQKELENAQVIFEEKSKMLPKQQEIPNLLRGISDLGRNAGLDFLTFKPGSEIPKDFYAEIPVDISIRGPYHNVGSFLDQVSKLERIVTVNNIKLGSPREDRQEMLLNSDCRLLTYRFTNIKLEANNEKK